MLSLCTLLALSSTVALRADPPVRVFILAGQSNMEGKAKVSLLETQLELPGTKDRFQHLRSGVGKDGAWVERHDVWIKFLDRKGPLTVGYGSPNCIGPELEFGNTVGDHFEEPVLILKTAWGGKSLYRDFRPPSADLPESTPDDIRDSFGHYYRLMLADVQSTLANLGEHFPELRGRDHEIAGFVWFQGWNDMVNAEHTAAYGDLMSRFIRDVRKDLGVQDLPFVIGQLGVGGPTDTKKQAFKDAQAAPMQLPEFAGNLALVRTDAFWDQAASDVFEKGWKEHLDEWNKVGSDRPYHYLGSVKTMSDIGKAFGQAVLALRGIQADRAGR